MSIAEKFLRKVADVLEVFSIDRTPKIDPAIMIFCGLLFTFLVSFSNSLLVYLLYVSFSFAFMTILRADYRRLLILTISWFFFVFAIFLPTIFENPNTTIFLPFGITLTINSNNLMTALKSALRTSTAILTLGVFLSYLGWRNIAIGLKKLRMPNKLIFMFTFFLKFLPHHIRHLIRLLFARESRIIVRGYRRYWFVLSTIIADLLVNSTYLAQRFALGLQSRCFSFDIEKISIKITYKEILFLFVAFLVISLHIAIEFLMVI